MNSRGWNDVTLEDRKSWFSAKDPMLIWTRSPERRKEHQVISDTVGCRPQRFLNTTLLKRAVSEGTPLQMVTGHSSSSP